MSQHIQVGISDVGIYLPEHYVNINTLAEARNIDPAKLEKGLGLRKMAICTNEETTPYMVAKAIRNLILDSSWLQHNLHRIDKIYLGSESTVDGAKPSITYAMEFLQDLIPADVMERIDFLDMTFACIGGTDAMLMCADYIRLNPEKLAIVVCADFAKYDLNTGGEYTQGGGAIALLMTANPKLLVLGEQIGVSSKHDYDFYKPLHNYSKKEILKGAATLLGVDFNDEIWSVVEKKLNEKKPAYKVGTVEGLIEEFWSLPESEINVQRKEPVFDGHYSNKCYQERIGSALQQFKNLSGCNLEDYKAWLFHLPYAYQGRRTAVAYWVNEFVLPYPEKITVLNEEIGEDMPPLTEHKLISEWLKKVAKTSMYLSFVEQKIKPSEYASGEIGNMYTGSVFMALLSTIHQTMSNSAKIAGEKVLFLAYGSGSKSKVFEGMICQDAPLQNMALKLQKAMENRKSIDVELYEKIHKGDHLKVPCGHLIVY